jgi:hypothetical protein
LRTLLTVALVASLAGGGRVGTAGVTVRLPAGWHAAKLLGESPASDPLTRLAVASAPIRPNARPCQVSAYTFAPTAVAVVVVEWRRSRGAVFPPRPRVFDATTLRVRPPPAIECFAGSGGSVQFTDHGRLLGLYVLAGVRARTETIAAARRVAESLRVTGR